MPLRPVTDGTPTIQSAVIPVAVPLSENSAISPAAVPPTPPLAHPAVAPPSEKPRERAASVQAFSARGDGSEGGNAVAAMRGRASEYDQMIGQVLDNRYLIERKLGEGGMGVVFAARHAVIEKAMAIKVLKREVMRDDATLKRFAQEAKAASRIGHPNIVDVTDFGTTATGLAYQVMEMLNGVTLGHALRQVGVMPPQRILPIANQIGRALEAAHDKGIVHRDLKPENVFLVSRDGRDDFVKIVDFGIARVLPMGGDPAHGPRLTRTGAVFGTPEYMAPEQASGRGDADGRADIYALGTICYELLTGRVPHRGGSAVRTIAMQMLDAIVPPSQVRPDLGVPPDFESVILRALAKRPQDRFQTMTEMVAALAHVNASLTIPQAPSASLAPVPSAVEPVAGNTGLHNSPPPDGGRRQRPPTVRRYADEPAFVERPSLAPMDRLLADSTSPVPNLRPSATGRILRALVALALCAGSAFAVYALVRSQRSPRAVHAVTPDAAVTRQEADAATAPIDAPPPAPPVDARPATAVSRRPDASPRGQAAPSVAITVVTNPSDDTSVRVNGTYRGPGGVTIVLPRGTKAEVLCSKEGYRAGRINVVWDMSRVVTCRLPNCVEGLKNPYDNCPEPTR